jgi:hypothetical protein
LVILSDCVLIGIDACNSEMAEKYKIADSLLSWISARISSSVDMAEERAERTEIREKRKAEEELKVNKRS